LFRPTVKLGIISQNIITRTSGDKIKAYRIKAGYSKRALAELAGIDETTIFRYENNQLQHSRQILDKIAITLNVCPNREFDS